MSVASERATIYAVESDTCLIGYWRNISIAIWGGSATRAAVRRCREVAPKLHAAYRSGHSHVAVVLNGSAMPTDDGQQELVAVMKAPDTGLVYAANVVEGEGFWASAIRSKLTQMRIKGGQTRIGLHSSIDEMASWLAAPHTEATGVYVAEPQLVQVVRDCREQAVQQLASARNEATT